MEPIPAPDPATPAALAPAPMYLAAESMSRLTAVVCSSATLVLLAGEAGNAETAGLTRWARAREPNLGKAKETRVIELIFE